MFLDGKELPTARGTAPDGLDGDETRLADEWRDPFIGAAHNPPRPGQAPETYWSSSTVQLEPGKRHLLEVTYAQGLGTDYSRFVDRAYRVDYLLRPARHWAEFDRLTLDVEVPPGRAVWSNLPLEQQDAGHYRAVVQGLPPENLSLFIAPGGGSGWLASLWWVRTSRAWLLVALTVAGAVVGSLLRASEREAPRRAGIFVGLGAPLLLFVLTPTYLFGIGAGGTVATWFVFLPGMLILYGITWRLSRASVL